MLVTGFEPFGGAAVNPSQLLVEALESSPPPGIVLSTAVLPVAYARAADVLRGAVRAAGPDVVICFGQADGRPGVSIERFAHNLDSAEPVDNDGVASDAEIDPNGPVAYRSTLPVEEIVAALRADGIPAAESRDAGGFLCNHVFYVLMRVLEEDRPDARGGFVHVPALPEQAVEKQLPSMPVETLARAARVIVATAAAAFGPRSGAT
ncbi:MAG: pyroglutamyl-peptidase [Gaiellaceae bacterium]|nr:pyroglutamyl-peptidase [Gaiellaceae bacterium]MDX6470270.1 pyroglutamyl-peptidase [Gaiellaceae bacterium]MDX6474257.1 pyroglutamyl-peptidase [Gaiellaceae bacterium]